MTPFKINPFKPVDFNEKAIQKVLEESGSLITDVKYDSVRCHLVITPTADVNGSPAARLYAMSRTDKAIPALRELFSTDQDKINLGQLLCESLYPEGIILDGEMMVKGVDFNTGSGMLRRKTPLDIEQLTYMIYGVLPYKEIAANSKDNIAVPYCVMQEQTKVMIHQLVELLPAMDWQLAESYDVFDMPSLYELYEKVRSEGHEGLVIKDPMTYWKRGKKVGMWKMKPEDTIDGKVVGLVWGTEGKANEGKVIGFEVLLEDSEVVVNATGLTQEQMNHFTANILVYEDYYLNWVAQVKFMEKTPDGSLRHPSFDCWRGLEGSRTVKS